MKKNLTNSKMVGKVVETPQIIFIENAAQYWLYDEVKYPLYPMIISSLKQNKSMIVLKLCLKQLNMLIKTS